MLHHNQVSHRCAFTILLGAVSSTGFVAVRRPEHNQVVVQEEEIQDNQQADKGADATYRQGLLNRNLISQCTAISLLLVLLLLLLLLLLLMLMMMMMFLFLFLLLQFLFLLFSLLLFIVVAAAALAMLLLLLFLSLLLLPLFVVGESSCVAGTGASTGDVLLLLLL